MRAIAPRNLFVCVLAPTAKDALDTALGCSQSGFVARFSRIEGANGAGQLEEQDTQGKQPAAGNPAIPKDPKKAKVPRTVADVQKIMAQTIHKMKGGRLAPATGRAIVSSCRDLVEVMRIAAEDGRYSEIEARTRRLREELDRLHAGSGREDA